MPEDEFKLRSAIWWMAVEFGERLKNDRQGTADGLERAAQERKWPIIFCARLVLERSFGEDGYQDELRKAYKGEWSFGEEKMGRWFEQIYDKAKKSVIYVYKEAAKRQGFVHRNWMRSETTVESLREFILAGLLDPVKPISKMD